MGDRLVASKGCGGVMRVAPAGLTGGDPFRLGCRANAGDEVAAALTAVLPAAELSPLSADEIGVLGQGWTAEEALAILAA